MNRSNTIATIILGAAAGVAILKFLSMTKEEKNAFFNHLKDTTNDLLDNAEDTVEKVEHYMTQFKSKPPNQFADKLLVLKKMFKDLYSSEQRFLL